MTGTGPELSSSARALLDAAREGMAPDAAAIERVRGKVAAATAGGVAASALAIKLGIAGLVVAVAVGAIVQVTRDDVTGVVPHVAVPAPRVDEPPPRPVVYEVAPPPLAPEPAPIEMAAESMRRPAVVAPEPAAPELAVDLAREVTLIDRATAALAKNDPRRALATLELHALETRGKGQLAEDAAAIEIEALCRLRSTTVAAKLDAFDARFPRSAQRSRLTSRCQEP